MKKKDLSKIDFYTVDEFALFLHVHSNTVRRSIISGRINAFRVGPGKKSSYRIPSSEIHRLGIIGMEEVIERIIQDRKTTQEI